MEDPVQLFMTRAETPTVTAEMQRRWAENAQRLLADAGMVLSASMDYHTCLTNLARMVVPFLADWCAVDILEQNGSAHRLAISALNPALEDLEWQIQRHYPINARPYQGAPSVLRSGEPELYSHVPDEMLQASAHDEQHLDMLRRTAIRSFMSLPLMARGRILGAITLATLDGRPAYTSTDMELPAELARRAALAIDNAWLYKEAQDAIRSRDAFLSIAAHELKTPLTSLLGYTDLLRRRAEREGGFSERDLRALRVISDQAGRLNKMINSLLDLSRIQTGQLSIERGVVDLVALAQSVVAEVQPTLTNHTLQLTLEPPDQPLVLRGDALRLEQVLQNLIQNAVKYSPGGGAVGVHLEVQQEKALIAVSDQGLGIPVEAMSRLFSRFFRAANASNHGIGGMGVGLYVVREIVTLHGGTIDVTSSEGVGSTFTVSLPLG